MPISLPTSPALNDTYTYGSKTWKWDGTKWNIVYSSVLTGITGPTGSKGQSLITKKSYMVSMLKNTTISNLTINPGTIHYFSTGSYNITIDSQTASINNSTSKINTINLANSILISPSGTLFATMLSGPVANISCSKYLNNLFIIGHTNGSISTSTNAATWINKPTGSLVDITSLAYGNGVYVAATGSEVRTSTDTTTWTARTLSDSVFELLYANGIFLAGGNSRLLATSTDSITWTARTSGFTGTNDVSAFTYGNGIYVMAGNGGNLSTSTNSITWTTRTSGFGANLIRSLTYGNNIYVAGADLGLLRTSTDAITWTARTSGISTDIQKIEYVNDMYIGADFSANSLIVSTNAISWTTRTTGFSGGGGPTTGIAYGNNILLISTNVYSRETSSLSNPVIITFDSGVI